MAHTSKFSVTVPLPELQFTVRADPSARTSRGGRGMVGGRRVGSAEGLLMVDVISGHIAAFTSLLRVFVQLCAQCRVYASARPFAPGMS